MPDDTGDNEDKKDGYIVEFVSVGKSVKVTAFDPVSLRDATIVGSPRASRKQLADLAVRKLKYLLKRDKGE